jgi:hypothetical protein
MLSAIFMVPGSILSIFYLSVDLGQPVDARRTRFSWLRARPMAAGRPKRVKTACRTALFPGFHLIDF